MSSSVFPPLEAYPSSSDSSDCSSRSSTGKHSPPPLWPATDKLLHQLKLYLDTGFYDPDSNDLVLPVTPVEFTAFRRELRRPRFLDPAQVPRIRSVPPPPLHSFLADHPRYTWNRHTSTLTIPCMAGPVHDALIPFLSFFREDMSTTHATTPSERRSIIFYTGTTVALLSNPASSLITGRGKHATGLVKEPDAAFEYMDRRSNAVVASGGCPRVVFEVAFSQTYESVLEDARQWLVRSQGAVRLCVVVKLHEHPNRHKALDVAEIAPKLVEQRRVNDAAGTAEPSAASSGDRTPTTASTASRCPDERMASLAGYNLFLNSPAEHAQWVGSLSGFMELYRLSEDASGIIRDGPRYVCPPPPLPPSLLPPSFLPLLPSSPSPSNKPS